MTSNAFSDRGRRATRKIERKTSEKNGTPQMLTKAGLRHSLMYLASSGFPIVAWK